MLTEASLIKSRSTTVRSPRRVDFQGSFLVGRRPPQAADFRGCHMTQADAKGVAISKMPTFVTPISVNSSLLGRDWIAPRFSARDSQERSFMRPRLLGLTLPCLISGACDLSESDLMDANLTDANLTANLRRARLIRCTSECIIRDVEVTDCQVQDTIGRPDERTGLGSTVPLAFDRRGRTQLLQPARNRRGLPDRVTHRRGTRGVPFSHAGVTRRQRVGVGVHLTGEPPRGVRGDCPPLSRAELRRGLRRSAALAQAVSHERGC